MYIRSCLELGLETQPHTEVVQPQRCWLQLCGRRHALSAGGCYKCPCMTLYTTGLQSPPGRDDVQICQIDDMFLSCKLQDHFLLSCTHLLL